MTDYVPMGGAVQAAAGWYPDPEGAPQSRWWNGVAWTEHVSQAPVGAAGATRPTVGPDVVVDTPWIWLIATIPILSMVGLFFFNPTGFVNAERSTDPLSLFGIGYLVSWLLSFLIWAATALFANLDYKQLVARGVERPFHWGFGFIPYPVYLIGRAVIVYQVAKRGLGPIWAYVGVFVLSMVIAFVWIFAIMASMFSTFPYYSS